MMNLPASNFSVCAYSVDLTARVRNMRNIPGTHINKATEHLRQQVAIAATVYNGLYCTSCSLHFVDLACSVKRIL
jgi:hypothetical protein